MKVVKVEKSGTLLSVEERWFTSETIPGER